MLPVKCPIEFKRDQQLVIKNCLIPQWFFLDLYRGITH
jgi:hypothetical protein